jgi:hypothetical protein
MKKLSLKTWDMGLGDLMNILLQAFKLKQYFLYMS